MCASEEKFYEAENLADKFKKIRIFLSNGKMLVGERRVIEPAFDDEMKELPNCLVFKPEDYKHTAALRNEDILKAEKA